jgi:hypothetical protein
VALLCLAVKKLACFFVTILIPYSHLLTPFFMMILSPCSPPVITPEENLSLCAIPEEREINQAIYQLGLHKAPDPDGFTGLFYKTYWPIIHLDVINFVQIFSNMVFSLKNSTILNLL